MGYDRGEVLARTDLAALADQLLGPHKGRGRSASWACPAPNHGGQTGKTPPVSLYIGSTGTERWKCHACGAGGTAIDLVMSVRGLTFSEGIEALARQGGVGPDDPRPGAHGRARERPTAVAVRTGPGVNPAVEQYVAACEAFLWTSRGTSMRRWLSRRCLNEEVLRANRVGADPGPRLLPRAEGLPRRGLGVVLPVLGPDDKAVYLQTRYLRADGHRYDNPHSTLVGPSPRMSEMRLAGAAVRDDVVIVCEGIPDALTTSQAGYRAVAVLGAGYPDDRVAAGLVRRFPTEHLVMAFDADDRGRAGASQLAAALDDHGAGSRISRIDVPAAGGDVNGWLQMDGDQFASQFAHALRESVGDMDRGTPLAASLSSLAQPPSLSTGVDLARPPSAPEVLDSVLPPEPGSPLESIYYRFVLVDDPAKVRANVSRISSRLAAKTGDSVLPDLGERPESDLDASLQDLLYRHVLAVSPEAATATLAELNQEVSRWHADLDRGSERLVSLRPVMAESIISSFSMPEPPDLGVAL